MRFACLFLVFEIINELEITAERPHSRRVSHVEVFSYF